MSFSFLINVDTLIVHANVYDVSFQHPQYSVYDHPVLFGRVQSWLIILHLNFIDTIFSVKTPDEGDSINL